MEDLLNYMYSNGFTFGVNDTGIITIDGDTYQLTEPNRDGLFFDRGFNFIGEPISANNYIYKFGGLYYTLKKGDEGNVKLKLFKYIGKVNSDFETHSFLGVHGPFELLNGSGAYDDWCKKAKFLGVEVLGLCEKDTLAGALKFQLACDKYSLKCVIGETITVFNVEKDITYKIKLYVENNEGWQNLLMLNKYINTAGGRVREEDVAQYLSGLIVVLDPKSLRYEDIPKFLLKRKGVYYQLDSVRFENDDRDALFLRNTQLYLSSKLLPTNICDAYYIDQEYCYLKDKLNRIGGVSDDISCNQYFKSNEEYFYEIKSLFDGVNEDSFFDLIDKCIVNTNSIADRCSEFKIEIANRHLPQYKMTEEEISLYGTKEDMLISLVADGLRELNIVDDDEFDKYLNRIETELDVIRYGNVIDYFLILWDIVKWCKKNNILVGFGRGSAGGSLVAYLLHLHHINPFDYDLLFERFLSKARVGKLVDVEVVNIVFDNDLEIELDSNEIITIFRHENKMNISAKDLHDGDKIIGIKSGDIEKMLRRKNNPI